MAKSRPSYSQAFKQDAANLVLEKGYSMKDACEAMNVGPTALRRWIKQLQQEQQGITPKAKAITHEQREIQQLKNQVKQLEWECMILKKATALVMSDNIKK